MESVVKGHIYNLQMIWGAYLYYYIKICIFTEKPGHPSSFLAYEEVYPFGRLALPAFALGRFLGQAWTSPALSLLLGLALNVTTLWKSPTLFFATVYNSIHPP